MMVKILKTLVIVPLALALLAFAVANRQLVMVSFDPFDSSDPSLTLTLPLFIVIIAAVIVGVIVGGIATWFGQRRWRRTARRLEAEIREARQKTAGWNAHVPISPRLSPAPQAPAESYPASPLAIGQDKPQDKPGAAL